jgi:hypothetical protein
MNRKTLGRHAVDVAKRAAVPLLAVLVIVYALPGPDWLTAQFRAYPFWGALILGVGCFLAGSWFVAQRGALARNLAPELRDAGLILLVVIALLVLGLILAAAATTLAAEEVRPAALRAATLWAIAWFVAGFLTGFLFGVPKVVAEGTAAAPQSGASAAAWNFAQRPNTNLEQISDWLTKIIVGVGLVELKQVPGHLRNAAQWVAESLSASGAPSQAAVSFAGSLIVYFSIVGFLAGYLLTLLFLAGAFGRAGRQAYGGVAAFGDDALSAKIRDYWRPNGGPPDPVNTQKLTEWIRTHLPEGTSITDLISAQEFKDARQRVVAELVDK